MTTNPQQLPAHWPEALTDAFWTAVNAPTYDESAAATLALTQQLAALIRRHPGAIPYRPQLDEDGGFWWDTRDRDAAADLIDPTRGAVPAAVSVPPPTREAAWREAADTVEAMNEGCGRAKPCASCDARTDAADDLRDIARRMADEAQQQEGSDVGSEFVRQADQPDEAGLAAFEMDLAEAQQQTTSATCPHCKRWYVTSEPGAHEASCPQRPGAGAQQQADTETPTESVIYEVVGDWGVDSADSEAGARAAVAKWLRAYPKCGAYAQQRIVREWPDGSEFYGPWTDLPPAVPVQPAAADTREEGGA